MTVSLEMFTERAKEVHGNMYDYSKLKGNWGGMKRKVQIKCKTHGLFEQTGQSHVSGRGCPECGKIRSESAKRMTLDDFIKRSAAIHKNKYDYSKVRWRGTKEFVAIGCPVHGIFEQKAAGHLIGKGCKQCACLEVNEKLRTISVAQVSKKLSTLHPNLIFPAVHNKTTKPIDFECKVHGSGTMKLGLLLSGSECNRCSIEKRAKKQTHSTQEFIDAAVRVHGNRYGYEDVVYVNAHTKIVVNCKEHGPFEIVPCGHTGFRKSGCPKCKSKSRDSVTVGGKDFVVLSRPEKAALHHRVNTGIRAEDIFDQSSKKIPVFFGDFMGMKRYLPDFYVPSKKLIIEVKSPSSFGIEGKYFEKALTLVRRVQKRAKAVKTAGYKFKLIVVDEGRVLRLPRGWESMKYSTLRSLRLNGEI